MGPSLANIKDNNMPVYTDVSQKQPSGMTLQPHTRRSMQY